MIFREVAKQPISPDLPSWIGADWFSGVENKAITHSPK